MHPINPSSSPKPKLLVLVGPTAVGKTRLSLDLAKDWNCEIISGDSMQVYRGMDVGTAKLSKEEQAVVPHHMIDIHDPDYPYSVSEFQEAVIRLIPEITARKKLPFIVGGTGLYVESVCYNFAFTPAPGDEAFRMAQETYADQHGEEALFAKLKEVDAASAEKLHPNDKRRIIRALEIFHFTGIPLSKHLTDQKKESPYELCIIGLTMDRSKLYARIEERVDQMLQYGLVQEVAGLLEKGISPDAVSMQGLGYKEIVRYLLGEITLEEAAQLLKRNTRRFAKRQLSWFRHMKEIEWVDMIEEENYAIQRQKINDIITGKLA